ncbi:MAG: hypothetical protein HY537_04550 [Deltaproteobacteria bacterium]|nr:hypothetical protein [Deltaproteobacteria bacterium]
METLRECLSCHENMTMEQAAKAAKTIHHPAGMVDLTVNGEEELVIVKSTDMVSVDLSVQAGDKAGLKATWWVICHGPRGWISWDGKKWKGGLRPWRKNVAVTDVDDLNVLKRKLAPGYYSYWVGLVLSDGSENFASVPVLVRR